MRFCHIRHIPYEAYITNFDPIGVKVMVKDCCDNSPFLFLPIDLSEPIWYN